MGALLFGPGSAAARTIYTLSEREFAAVEFAPNGDVIAVDENAAWRIGADNRTRRLTPQSLSFVSDIAAGPDGTMFVLSEGIGLTTTIGRFDARDRYVELARGLPRSIGIAVEPNGTPLIAAFEKDQILRVLPNGASEVVAGTGAAGFSGDGGPATAAMLDGPIAVDVTPTREVLIADAGNSRIRRVARGGTISTVAGTGSSDKSSGDRGPATGAGLAGPLDVVAGRHGGFAVAEFHTIRRVTRAGVIRTVAGNPRASFSETPGVGVLNGDGGDPRSAPLDRGLFGGDLAIDRKDGYAYAGRYLRYIAPLSGARLAVAIRATLPARRRVSYAVTRPARLTLQLRSRGQRRIMRRRVAAGRGHFRLPRSVPAGTYTVRLTAEAERGRRAAQRIALFYARRLTGKLARQTARAAAFERPLMGPDGLLAQPTQKFGKRVGPCQRLSTRRIDCEIVKATDPQVCSARTAIWLTRRGHLNSIGYHCDGSPRRQSLSESSPMEPFT